MSNEYVSTLLETDSEDENEVTRIQIPLAIPAQLCNEYVPTLSETDSNDDTD